MFWLFDNKRGYDYINQGLRDSGEGRIVQFSQELVQTPYCRHIFVILRLGYKKSNILIKIVKDEHVLKILSQELSEESSFVLIDQELVTLY